MVDSYTKFILTVIAIALVALVVRPSLEVKPARAGETVDVQVVGIRVGEFVGFGGALPVKCVAGCPK